MIVRLAPSFATATLTTLLLATSWASGGASGGGWVTFTDATASRMPTGEGLNDPTVSTNDNQEKDYIWGDVDKDGDIDLIVVRKMPFTFAGGRRNVLFMNEGTDEGHAIDGVLVDRTELVSAADDGGQGFFDLTNDRDVVLTDVNGDTWLDIVTAVTISRGEPKTISHPRVYINLAEDMGVWQGFRYEEARIPQLYTIPGGAAVTPRFCSVAAGDVTGDQKPDLYFGDYDSSGAGGDQQPPGTDLNDRLLVNDGTGTFTDSEESRMTAQMLRSAFGTAVAIEDMNGDGVNDVVKDTGLTTPTQVSVSYNDEENEGAFDAFDVIYTLSPYFISVGDLNGDGRLDIVVVDDGTDRFMLNNGNDGNEHATFTSFTFPQSDGFGGNSVIADLNNDGFNDVLIADVDVDETGCGRRMHIYRNLGNLPDVSFSEQGEVVPNNMLRGTHDIAVFDINGDGWLDLVIGRCSGTEIWMNEPPVGIVFRYPTGLPAFVEPGVEHEFEVQFEAFGGAKIEPDSGRLFVSIEGGLFEEEPMDWLGDHLYLATLPAIPCTDQLRFYVSGELADETVQTDPAGAPAEAYNVISAAGTEITLRDEIEGDTSGWTITSDQSLITGEWEAVDPNGTIFNNMFAAPEDDATAGEGNVRAFVTQNGQPNEPPGMSDVDGGPTHLVTPAIDLEGVDATISYARWFFCSEEGDPIAEDFLTIEVSANGTDWVHVEDVPGTGNAWEHASFVVGDYVVPTSTVQVRFTTADQLQSPASSIVEAGIDNFQVETLLCEIENTCPEDLDDSGAADFGDILAILAAWGNAGGPEDLDESGFVDFGDILAVLGAWGPCP